MNNKIIVSFVSMKINFLCKNILFMCDTEVCIFWYKNNFLFRTKIGAFNFRIKKCQALPLYQWMITEYDKLFS